MDRISILNSLKKKLNIPFTETYNRFAMLWLGQTDKITPIQDNEYGGKGYNEIKMLSGTIAIAFKNGGNIDTDTAKRIKHAVVSRGYMQEFTDLEEIRYWDLIKAIDTGWEAISSSKPRPCDYRIVIQLVSPDLFKETNLNDSVLKTDAEESKTLKKWRTKSFKIDRGVLINELNLYITDKVK